MGWLANIPASLLIFLSAQGQKLKRRSSDAGAFLWAFRALKRTAKLKPSLRDEEVSAFRAKIRVMTRFQRTAKLKPSLRDEESAYFAQKFGL
jgi:hypothetical protein